MISTFLYGKDRYRTLEEGEAIVQWLKDMSMISLLRNWVKAKLSGEDLK